MPPGKKGKEKKEKSGGFLGWFRKSSKEPSQEDLAKAQQEEEKRRKAAEEENLQILAAQLFERRNRVATFGSARDRAALEAARAAYNGAQSVGLGLNGDSKPLFQEALQELETALDEAEGRVSQAERDEVKKTFQDLTAEVKTLKTKDDSQALSEKMEKYSQAKQRAAQVGRDADPEIMDMRKELEQEIRKAAARVSSDQKSRRARSANEYFGKIEETVNTMNAEDDRSRLESVQNRMRMIIENKDKTFTKEEVAAARRVLTNAVKAAEGKIDKSQRDRILSEIGVATTKFQDMKTAEHKGDLGTQSENARTLRMEGSKLLMKEAFTKEEREQFLSAQENMNREEEAAQKRVDYQVAQTAKLGDVFKELNENRNTPLETLIWKTKSLMGGQGGAAYKPEGTEETDAAKKQTEVSAEEKKGKGGQSLLEQLKGAFSTAEEFGDSAEQIFGAAGDSVGIASDLSDLKKVQKTADELKDVKKGEIQELEFEKGGVGITSGLLNIVSTVFAAISVVKAIAGAHKSEASSTADRPTMDNQERWLTARDLMHKGVDLLGGLKDLFGPFIGMVPLLGSSLDIVMDGIGMTVDVMDLTTSSVHIDQIRKDKQDLYDRIQAKKEKYSRRDKFGNQADAGAASAYTINGKWYQRTATDMDDKRKELMKEVALKNQTGADKIRIVTAGDLRSRNDSRYREAQYGLGERINRKRAEVNGLNGYQKQAAKTELRRMEALEMMEEYRELDKSHKKMVKALLHNLEAIIQGGVSLTANGLYLAGEIACMTGIGAVAGAALISASGVTKLTSGAYSLGRTAATKTYHGIREKIGTGANKETTRTDMAISLMERMKEVGDSVVWNQTTDKFKAETDLKTGVMDQGMVRHDKVREAVRQGRNVRHLKNVLRRGLDAKMSELNASGNSAELRDNLAKAFSQG